MKGHTWKIASLLTGLAVAAPAVADIPKGWQKVETDCYEMGLPQGWKQLRREKLNPALPWAGAWGYVSSTARQKIFIRCSTLALGDIRAHFARSLQHLQRKVAKLQTVSQEFTTGEKNRPLGVGVYQGWMKALDPKTQKVVPQLHVIVRMIQLYPGRGLKLALTYAFAGERVEQAMKFMEQHSATIDPVDAAEMKKLAAAKPPQGAKPQPGSTLRPSTRTFGKEAAKPPQGDW
jgi:hypothetical protein